MLHYVHQLVSNCVCLLFSAGQVVYSWFLNHLWWKQLLSTSGNNAEKHWDSTKTANVLQNQK